MMILFLLKKEDSGNYECEKGFVFSLGKYWFFILV